LLSNTQGLASEPVTQFDFRPSVAARCNLISSGYGLTSTSSRSSAGNGEVRIPDRSLRC
jgi:hypothetical protein